MSDRIGILISGARLIGYMRRLLSGAIGNVSCLVPGSTMLQISSHKLVGPAAVALSILQTKAARLREEKRAVKVLLLGPRGAGKTDSALRFAVEFAGAECNVDQINGKDLTVDTVRAFQARAQGRSLFGTGRFCLVADECDKMTADARDLLLSVLDQMHADCAFIGTTNKRMTEDDKLEAARFQSRLHCIEVGAPSAIDIQALILAQRPDVPEKVAASIASACGGDVRAALIDAENFLDTQTALAA
jgi:replication-associated recombination protein RarA